MKLFLLALVAAAVTLTVVASTDQNCKWGPSYWCQSRETAERCGQTKYCNTEVWAKKENINDALLLRGAPVSSWKTLKDLYKSPSTDVKGPQGDGEACDVCKIVVGYIQEAIKSNTTEDVVKAEIKQVCTYLGVLGPECRKVIDEYFDMIWQMAANEVDPNTVCTEIKLCSSKAKVELASVVSVQSIKCELCEFFAKSIVIAVNNQENEANAKKAMEDLCKAMKPVSTECTGFVNKYFDTIWKELEKAASSPQMLCSQLFPGCSSVTKTRSRRGIIKGLECTVCKGVMKKLLDMVKGQNLADKISKLVKPICEKMPSEDQSTCEEFTSALITVVVNDVMNTALNNTTVLCQQIGYCDKKTAQITKRSLVDVHRHRLVKKHSPKGELCDICKQVVGVVVDVLKDNGTEQEAEQAVENLCSSLPVPLSTGCKLIVKEYFPQIWQYLVDDVGNATVVCTRLGLCATVKAVSKRAQLPQQDLCDICKLVAQYLKTIVDSNSTEAEIKQALETLCGLLPSPGEGQCKTLVNTYFNLIWDLIKEEVDSGEICRILRLCNSTVSLQQIKKPAAVSAGSCELCKLVVGYMDRIIKENATEVEVKNELRKLCSYLGSEASECQDLFDQYFDTIWALLTSELEPDVICSMLKLCTSTKRSVRSAKVQSDQCDVCKLAAQYVYAYMHQNGSKAEVKTFLGKVCGLLNADQKEICSNLVQTYFNVIWQMAEDKLHNATSICELIGLCSSKLRAAATAQKPMAKIQSVEGSIECAVCTLVMKELESLISQNSTEQQIKAALEKACSLLPSSLSSECTSLIDEYGDEIIALIIKAADPKEICSIIRLCTTPSVSVEKKVFSVGSSTGCKVCEALLTALKDIMPIASKPSVELLEEACKVLPSDVRSECVDVVKEYGPELLKLIDGLIDPQALCKEIKLCTAATATE